MAKKRASAIDRPSSNTQRLRARYTLREASALLLFGLACYLFVSLFDYHIDDPGIFNSSSGTAQNLGGSFGAMFADVLLYLAGYVAYSIPLIMLIHAGWLVLAPNKPSTPQWQYVRWINTLLLLVVSCALLDILASNTQWQVPLSAGAGGLVGFSIGFQLRALFGQVGAALLMLSVFLTSFAIYCGFSWINVIRTGAQLLWHALSTLGSTLYRTVVRIASAIAHGLRRSPRPHTNPATGPTIKPAIRSKSANLPTHNFSEPTINPSASVKASNRSERERQLPVFDTKNRSELPPLSLLAPPAPPKRGYSAESLKAMSRLLELKLREFGIETEVVAIHPGPIITRFELQLAPGIKVSRITALGRDIARSMSLISVRVVEVILGKSTIGIEIPNEEREVVRLADILNSSAYEQSPSPLTLGLGKDINGKPVVADLSKMPHLLVAGTTGSGKSVAINAMLVGLLYKALPEEMRLILIDPKMLELNTYDDIPHLLTPVVTDMQEAANALHWCVAEMERRYKLMAAVGVRNIASYNRTVKEAIDAGTPIADPLSHPNDSADSEPATVETLPYIVVVIDEYADMMMSVGKKLEELITRLAQKARAAGIHLILATQRPSVDVVTGLIKSNIPTRIAFQVSSRIDSRTILDQAGAEQLLGHGDMLFMPPGKSAPERIHGAFLDDDEIKQVVAFLKKTGRKNYLEDVTQPPSKSTGAAGDASESDDAIYDLAVEIVTETRKVSVSYLQRRLKVGYNRAARLVEAMEADGVVSQVQPNGGRRVLAPPPPEI